MNQNSSSEHQKTSRTWLQIYYPILLIGAFLFIVSLKNAHSFHDWMLNFMAGFFLVFSFFKLLDLKGFQEAYKSYDILAKKYDFYGLIYPFLELLLGLAFLFKIYLLISLWMSLVLMGVSSIGVISALIKRQKLRCACLGTILILPMSTITLIEDVGMMIMSCYMLYNI